VWEIMRRPQFWIILILCGVIGYWITPFSKAAPNPSGYGPNQSSHSLALTESGDTLLVVNSDSNSISLIDTTSRIKLIEIPVGRNPRAVALYGNYAFIANQGSDTISIVDLSAKSIRDTIPVGDRPVGVAVSPDGRFLAIAEFGSDSIRFLDTTSLDHLSTHLVADRPYGLSFTPDGDYLLISHLLGGIVTRLPVQPFRTYLPDIHLHSLGLESRIAGNIQSSSLNSQISIPTWPQVAPAPAVIVNHDGTRAYLPQTMANGLGLNTQFDTTVFPKVSVLNLETWTHQTSEHISLPETDQPVGLPWDAALTKNDTELWVVNAASNDVSIVDIINPLVPIRRAHVSVGNNPRGILLSPDGNTAFTNNTMDGTVSVIDAQTYTVMDEIPSTNIPLPPLILTGKQLFHSSARPELSQAAWISCNTCHIEGEQDGRTWQLQFLGQVPPGEQPIIKRNTTSLLGMIETYPLRWSAEWDESADSEFSIRFEQFGTGLIAGDMHPTLGTPNQGRSNELDALAAFIDSLSVPERYHTLSPSESRGKELFESPITGCLNCHPPPLYTDLKQHDVGTGDGEGEWFGPIFDTPTLRFLFDSPPYLHDGRAETLLDVLTTFNSNDQHGFTSHLISQELVDLTAFLMTLPFE
jgi:YVTN family beta-propeller protein